MKKHKINISKMIFKSWDKHTETWCRIAFMLMIPSALSRVFATICIIFGFVLLAIIRKGYEEYWHLDDADKEKYHELMALRLATVFLVAPVGFLVGGVIKFLFSFFIFLSSPKIIIIKCHQQSLRVQREKQ